MRSPHGGTAQTQGHIQVEHDLQGTQFADTDGIQNDHHSILGLSRLPEDDATLAQDVHPGVQGIHIAVSPAQPQNHRVKAHSTGGQTLQLEIVVHKFHL